MKETRIVGLLYLFSCVSLLTIARPAFAQSNTAAVRLESGIAKEEVDGDLKSAMEIYQKIASDLSAPREVRAKALLRLAGCEEKLGRQQARQLYEQVVRDYADQPAATQARTRLAAIKEQEHPAAPTTMTVRKIERSEEMTRTSASDTDGQRIVYQDHEGNLYFGDLAGRNKRLIFKAQPDDALAWMPARDFSMVWIGFMAKPNRPASLAVVRMDGTRYRELIRDDALDTILGGNSFDASWSWDDRYLLVWGFYSRHLWLVSISDGQRRELVRLKDGYINKAVFSPDGRFIAYEIAPLQDQAETSRVFIMPVGGGEARQVYESAPRAVQNPAEKWALCDWTADGRYLGLADAPRGKTGLYLLPVQNGASVGAPVLVRYADVLKAYTTAGGALVYSSLRPGDQAKIVVASLDAYGRVGKWQRLELRGGALNTPWPSFSFDGSRILYVAEDPDPAGGTSLISHDLSNGSERVLYRAVHYLQCQSDAHGPSVFCTEPKGGGRTDLLSVSLKSGDVHFVQSFRDSTGIIRLGPFVTGKALYLVKVDARQLCPRCLNAVVRWDSETQQETRVIEFSKLDRVLRWWAHSADDCCVIGADGKELYIKSVPGDTWKPLVRANPGGCFASTPDSKFVIYPNADGVQGQAMFRIPIQGGEPERIGDAPPTPESCHGLWASPDGRRLLAVIMERNNEDLWLLENFIPSDKKSRGVR